MSFLNSSFLKLVLSNHLFKIVAGLSNFLIIALIAKITNSEILGEFTTIYATIILISSLTFWGLGDGFVILKDKYRLRNLTVNSLIICVVNGLISSCLILFFYFGLTLVMKLFLCAIVFSFLTHNLLSAIYRVIGKYNNSIFVSSIQVNVIFYVILYLSQMFNVNYEIFDLIEYYFFSHIISFLISIIYFFCFINQKYFDSNKSTVTISSLKYVYSHNTPLVVSDVVNNFIGTLDIIILNGFLSFSEIANYKIATTFGKLIKVSLSSFSNYMLPELSTLLKDKPKEAFSYISINYKYIFIIAILVLLGVSLFGSWAIDIAFGDEYETAYYILLILLIGYSFNNYSGPNGTILLALGAINKLFIIDIILI